jgi:hypothetical protein
MNETIVLEGSTHPRPEAAIHDTFCELARNLAAEARVTFRYVAGERAGVSGEPFVLCINPEDLANYLGVRGFALISDTGDSGCYRVAVARRCADRTPCCKISVSSASFPGPKIRISNDANR